jgi:glycosyltransferase involved in cell wall biosynthesis
MEVDLTIWNGLKRQNWYDTQIHRVVGYPTNEDIMRFCLDLDVIILAETPLNYELYTIARSMGVKTAVVINWEFFDHIVKPELPLPDMIIMPSTWHAKDAESFCLEHNIKFRQIHHPVDREEIPYRKRITNFTMHLAGNPAVNDRNGTWLYLQAKPDGVVITQNDDLAYQIRKQFRHSTVHTGIEKYKHIYDYGDIMVLPRKYGGNCLPLNEALASGMPVIMPDIEPNNSLLPKEWLVPAKIVDTFTPRTQVDIYECTIDDLYCKIQEIQSMDIELLSEMANSIAHKISWETLKPKYIEALESLL